MLRPSTKALLLAAALCLACAVGSAQVCSEWIWSNPLPQGNRLNGAVHGPAGFVAVGSAGTVLTSKDGASWTPRFPDTRAELFDVAWNDSLFAAIGAGGAAFTSPDGVFWAKHSTSSAATLSHLAWNGTLFAAVGEAGTILTSADGSAWTARASGTDQALHDIAWNGARFVAVGELGTILVSSDGVVWLRSSFDTRDQLLSVAWNGSEFLVGGSAFMNALVLHGKDGLNWTADVLGLSVPMLRMTTTSAGLLGVGDNGHVF